MVVLFLNDQLRTVMPKTKRTPPLLEKIQEMQVNIFPVGFGEYTKLSELNKMATEDGTARHFGEYESPETLGTAVIQGSLGRFKITIKKNPPCNDYSLIWCGKNKKVLHAVVTVVIEEGF